jgi:hypothetical protein
MTVKVLATGFAAVVVIGAAVGLTAAGDPATVPVQPVVFGIPVPRDPAPEPPPASDLPTAEQLTDVLTNLSDAGVSYKDKESLVEGGISSGEGHAIDHELRKAYRNGELPLTFDVSNIQTAGPNTASADVAISGPKFPAPVTKPLTFVNQGGWVLSHDSAMALAQAVSAR